MHNGIVVHASNVSCWRRGFALSAFHLFLIQALLIVVRDYWQRDIIIQSYFETGTIFIFINPH